MLLSFFYKQPFRHATLNGFDVELFDKRSAIGGRWSSDTTQGFFYFSTTIYLNLGPFLHNDTKMQYSAIGCAFSDLPLYSTEAMSKLEAQKYLLNYAENFDLDSKVKLNTEVIDIRRYSDYEQTGKWTVKYKQYVFATCS